MKRNAALSVRESARGRERAFTLVELMAVLVTVFILAALIVPALARSDDNGARTVCLNNLRQMGITANLYAGDNRDYLPFCNWDGGGPDVGPGWLYNSGNGVIPDPTRAPWSINPITAWQSGLWFEYAQNQKYYLCPVDLESPNYLNRPNKLSSYVMDGAVSGFPSPVANRSCRVTDAWSPKCWLLWEPDSHLAGASVFNDGASFPDVNNGPGAIHSGNGSEILSAAGTVQFVTMNFIQNDENRIVRPNGPNGKTYVWWSPFTSNGGP